MTSSYTVPAFAIIGHPNEGKSTIVSTLAEDDQVRISPIPGETVACMDFPVMVDGREIIRFIDTPGFQNPRKTLAWFKHPDNDAPDSVNAFIAANKNNDLFSDECRLLDPVSKGAGIIYIVDGSRPPGKTDKLEMEILRLTGQPRIAVINNKEQNTAYIDDWKREFMKHFNAVRLFNGHTATYIERIELLESLKAIFQDWQESLSTVIDAFKQDWAKRNRATALIIIKLLESSMTHREKDTVKDDLKLAEVKQKQLEKYRKKVNDLEAEACRNIKKRYRHNIFNYTLPPSSVLHSDLFDKESIRILGLNPKQIAVAGGITGSMMGAAADIAAHGITFGLFTAIGGASGAGYAYFSKDKLIQTRVAGFKLGKKKVTTGPCKNIQFMYIQLDRMLLYYTHIINWAHGRRDNDYSVESGEKKGIVTRLPDDARKILDTFFSTVTRKKKDTGPIAAKAADALETILHGISLNRY